MSHSKQEVFSDASERFEHDIFSIKSWSSMNLRNKVELDPLKKVFFEKCDALSDLAVGTRITGVRTDDSALHDALGSEWQSVKETLSQSAQVRDHVDKLVKNAISKMTMYLFKKDKTTMEMYDAICKLELGAEVDRFGWIKLSAHSQAMQDLVATDDASNLASWTASMAPLSFNDSVPQYSKFSSTLADLQKAKIPEIAKKLTEELQSYLRQDPGVLRDKTKEEWVTSPDLYDLTQERRVKRFDIFCPSAEVYYQKGLEQDMQCF